ncbi:other 1 protein kinase [Favolaschia claudopus]|uniref:Other 1 protein kinase n=1 Tax=Favolaschia claudopus TaxID=2862362 RepID=A0AAW0BMU6_9AGAR
MDFESEPEMGHAPPWPFDTFTLSDGRSFQLADSVARSRCLDGHSLYTSRASLGSDSVVVKWCWSKTRMHAVRIIETAVSSAKARGDLWIVDHLPHIIWYEERRVSHQEYEREHGGSRTLQLLVEEELRPLTELTDAEELGHAFLGIFRCCRWLYERCRLMHRNINLCNLMYRRIDGKVHGVLAGFDLAVVLNEHSYEPHSENPLAFVACDLVDPSPLFPVDQYLYRFDLESLFYALALAICHYEHGMLIPPEKQPFKCWHRLEPTRLFPEKICFFFDSLRRWKPTPQFSSLYWLVVYLRALFKHGLSARDDFRYRKEAETGVASDDGFDGDTLGGHVTFDAFEAVFLTRLPPSKSEYGRASAEP